MKRNHSNANIKVKLDSILNELKLSWPAHDLCIWYARLGSIAEPDVLPIYFTSTHPHPQWYSVFNSIRQGCMRYSLWFDNNGATCTIAEY